MGSGHVSSEGWQHSAYIKHMQYVDANGVLQNPTSLSATVEDPNYYNLTWTPYYDDASWGYGSFFFGGPGRTIAGASAAKADFNGDGQSDILWQHTSRARYLWLMNGTAYSSAVSLGTQDPSLNIVGSGDFNGDGQADIIWQHTSGARYL